MTLPKRYSALLLVTVGAMGCGSRPETPRDANGATPVAVRSDPRTGTKRMVDTLAYFYAQAAANPERNQFLNRERVDAIQKTLGNQSGGAALQSRFLLAQERVLAGQTREGITELESLVQAANLTLGPNTPQSKPFFDLLAIAWLRLGEQENCNNNPAANVCILPLAGKAQHSKEAGARKAIALYERMLKAFPDDRGSQWLLNIAYMAVGGYPARVPKPWLIPGLAARHDASFPLFKNIAGELGVAVNGLSGGLCVDDFNRDGLLDLFMTSWGLNDPVHYFEADGRGGYVDRTVEAGVTGIVGGLNCVHADYDNDGYDDILILRGAWLGEAGAHPNSLLHNLGNGTFADVTFAAGLGTLHPRHSAAWADFNLDGYLDLFVGNESAVSRGGASQRSELFLNNGNGTFREVSHAVGIDLDAFVKGVTWGDVNNDGLPDLYASVLFGENRLFINRGGSSIKTWRFEAAPAAGGAALPVMSFPTWFWDYDQDGWEDLLVLSYDIRNTGSLHEAVALEYLGLPAVIPQADGTMLPVESSRLFRNNGNGTFSDVTKSVGLDNKVIFAMGSNFGDIDNDGWLDFYVGTGNPDLRSVIPNRMFRNIEGQRFEDVSLEGGFAHLQKGHATAFVDLDRDGDEDLFMVIGGAYQGDRFTSVLFENPGWKDRSWITFELQGSKANRSAIGARVSIDVVDAKGGTRTLRRTVGTGGSFGSGALQLHVGLGDAVSVKQVRITWPDAARSTSAHANLALRQVYRIVQGQEAVARPRPPVPFRRGSAAAHNMPPMRP